MAKPVVFVIGASGNVGSATLRELSAKYLASLEIRAGVRNPDSEKAALLKALPGVTVVRAEMGKKDDLKHTFSGVDVLYVVTPGFKNREEVVLATVEAAKEAGVKHILLISVMMRPENKDTFFARLWKKVDDALSKLGIPVTYLTLPFFMENHMGSKETIVTQSSIYGMVESDKKYHQVAVKDIGKASAVILADPSKHAGKTYSIISERFSGNDLAEALSAALGREIKYIYVPAEPFRQALLNTGLDEYVVNPLVEMYGKINDDVPMFDPEEDETFSKITGEVPTTLKSFVSEHADFFK